jgi:group I intron endonuclease
MIIYKVTNRINGKVYIGQTKVTLQSRWKQHLRSKDESVFHRAIRKYGAENFTVEQIDVACDTAEMNAKEQYWIAHYESMNRDKGYNMTKGGRSGAVDLKRSEATRRKIADSIRGAKHWSAKKVMNVETGEVFDTVSAAASAYNTSKSNIIGCCTNRPHYLTCKGCHWRYVI